MGDEKSVAEERYVMLKKKTEVERQRKWRIVLSSSGIRTSKENK